MLATRHTCRFSPNIPDDSADTGFLETPSSGADRVDSYSEQDIIDEKADSNRTISRNFRRELSRPAESEAESFSLYLAAISEIPLLSPEGERALSRDMHLARNAMTRALAPVPAVVQAFLQAYESAKKNQWELGHVVMPPPQAGADAGETAAAGVNGAPNPIADKAEIGRLLDSLSEYYAHWSAHQDKGRSRSVKDSLVLRHAMARTFAALPVAPEMLRNLYKTSQVLNERLQSIERHLATTLGLPGRRVASDSPPTVGTLGRWLSEPRFAPYREPICAARRDLHQLELAAGTDANSLRQAHTEAAAAWRRYEHAWSRLVEANLRLVISIARHFVRDGITLPDLVQEGNLGLFRASEKFDYRLGYRFSTYASFWIRQAVSRALPKQGRLIAVPRYMYDHITRLSALTADLQQKLVRNPSLEELVEAASLAPETVLTALGADQSVLSLDMPTSEEESAGLYDRLADQRHPDPFDTVNDAQVAEQVTELLKVLPEREALILRLHYGIGGTQPITLEQIARILGVTRERVRQLEVHALKLLRSSGAVELLDSLAD